MKISFNILVTMMLCIVHIQGFAQLPPSDPTYHLVFNDEFDKTYPPEQVNPKKWSRTFPWNLSSNFTDNVAWCFPGDTTPRHWDRAYIVKDLKDTTTIKVSKGTLKIITNKASYQGQVSNWPECDPDNPGYAVDGNKCSDSCKLRGPYNISRCLTKEILPFKYTTGMLFSKQKFYRGYFEIRFKLPPAPSPPYTFQGFGPNFWLWGSNPPVNWSSEIDIFEMFAFNPLKGDTNKFTSSIYYSDKDLLLKPSIHIDAIGNKLKNDTAWHTASAWWTDKFVKFYLDDSLFYNVQDIKRISVENLVEMNMIIDINSPANGSCNNFDTTYTQFPYTYEIDYIRVYQEK